MPKRPASFGPPIFQLSWTTLRSVPVDQLQPILDDAGYRLKDGPAPGSPRGATRHRVTEARVVNVYTVDGVAHAWVQLTYVEIVG